MAGVEERQTPVPVEDREPGGEQGEGLGERLDEVALRDLGPDHRRDLDRVMQEILSVPQDRDIEPAGFRRRLQLDPGRHRRLGPGHGQPGGQDVAVPGAQLGLETSVGFVRPAQAPATVRAPDRGGRAADRGFPATHPAFGGPPQVAVGLVDRSGIDDVDPHGPVPRDDMCLGAVAAVGRAQDGGALGGRALREIVEPRGEHIAHPLPVRRPVIHRLEQVRPRGGDIEDLVLVEEELDRRVVRLRVLAGHAAGRVSTPSGDGVHKIKR